MTDDTDAAESVDDVLARSFRAAMRFWASRGVYFTAALAAVVVVVATNRLAAGAWVVIALVTGQIYTRLGLRRGTTRRRLNLAGASAAVGVATLPWMVELEETAEQLVVVATLSSIAVVASTVTHPIPSLMLSWYSAYTPAAVLGLLVHGGALAYAGLALAVVIGTSLCDGFRQHGQAARLAQMEVEARDRSRTDPLTGLGNRRRLVERFEPRTEGSTPQVLAFIDLDGFKKVNDRLGHDGGDDVLRAVADHLADLVGDDLAVRLGGDEFVLLLSSSVDVARSQLGSLVHHVESELPDLDGVSIGLARASIGESLDSVLRRADRAMFDAKATVGRRIVVAD